MDNLISIMEEIGIHLFSLSRQRQFCCGRLGIFQGRYGSY